MTAKSEPAAAATDQNEGLPSALGTLEPVIRHLLAGLRGAAAATQAFLFLSDPAQPDRCRLILEQAPNGEEPIGSELNPTMHALAQDFPDRGPVTIPLPEGYEAIWKALGKKKPATVTWAPIHGAERLIGGILLAGGGADALDAGASVEVSVGVENLENLVNQVIRLEQENVLFSQLIGMLRNTRNLMRESEAGHLVNMTLSTLSRILGNNRLALFPTTVLGSHRTFVRHVDAGEAAAFHTAMMEHMAPRMDEKAQGRQARVDLAQTFTEQTYASFSSAIPWVLRDAGRTFLGMLYIFDNDPAQEDTLTHTVIRTIVIELERTLRRYLLEDDAAHAISELPYRIWSREYWLRRFEEEINLTGRRGTRVACGVLELLDYDRLLSEMDEMMMKESVLTFLQVVKASVRETDLITRLDRDHFGVLFLDASKAKVVPALDRIGSRLQQVVGGAAMAPRVSFVAGLSEFPWDGEGIQTILRRAWISDLIARSKGPFTVDLYNQEEAEAFLSQEAAAREELEVHLELLQNLVLPESSGTLPPSPTEER